MAMIKLQKKKTAEAEIRQQIKELKRQQDEMEERERKREAERRREQVKTDRQTDRHTIDRQTIYKEGFIIPKEHFVDVK